MAANIGQVTFWINAFIPRNVAGVTEEIKTGLNRGKTALPLPWYANGALYNLIEKPKGTAYLTDQRGFSNDMKTSARIQSAAAVTLHPTPNCSAPLSSHREPAK